MLMNLLNELRKRDKCEACRAFDLVFATSLINKSIWKAIKVLLILDIACP